VCTNIVYVSVIIFSVTFINSDFVNRALYELKSNHFSLSLCLFNECKTRVCLMNLKPKH